MSIDFEEKLAFLRNQKLFKGLELDALRRIARRCLVKSLEAGEVLYTSESLDRNVYIVFSGELSERVFEQGEIKTLNRFQVFDDFGSEAILHNRKRTSTISALKPSSLLYFNPGNFQWLLDQYPQVKSNLGSIARAYHQAQKYKFDWLRKDETAFMITRRHPLELILKLARPILAMGLSLVFLLVTRLIPGFIAVSTLIGVVLSIFSLLWMIWMGFDWQNDYFIITNERVVWIEEVIFSKSSRQEVPLSQIQLVNTQRSYWGRVFNYGDLVIKTFTHTGSLSLTFMRDPLTFQSLIDEQVTRIREKEELKRTAALRQTVKQNLGLAQAPEFPEADEEAPELDEGRTGLLQTRVVTYGEIKYFKHWMFLLKTTWWQLVGLGLITGLVFFQALNPKSSIPLPKFETTLFAAVCSGFILFFIAWYHFADYRNDLYLLTGDMLIDREKKPFGQESYKTAPLRNIQSIRVAKEGIFQVLMNYGSVYVNVADAVLDFHYVHNPAQIQRDIFYQKRQLEIAEEQMETKREHERISGYLEMYREVWKDEDLE